MRIAIPSHNRANLIWATTLAYLQKCGIHCSLIDIFVSSQDQLFEYSNALPNYSWHAIINANTDNVRDKFNYIHSYYEPGTEVVVIEDDIECINILAGEKLNKTEPTFDFIEHASRGFELCRRHNTFLWGINSNSNHFFMKAQGVFCFKLCVANMYGFIAEKSPILITQYTKTDYERTILYTQKYGGVIRLDYLCPITKNYKNPGGMQELSDDTRAEQERQASEYLANAYPDLCRLNTSKKSKYSEISLITKKPNKNNNTLFDGI